MYENNLVPKWPIHCYLGLFDKSKIDMVVKMATIKTNDINSSSQSTL